MAILIFLAKLMEFNNKQQNANLRLNDGHIVLLEEFTRSTGSQNVHCGEEHVKALERSLQWHKGREVT